MFAKRVSEESLSTSSISSHAWNERGNEVAFASSTKCAAVCSAEGDECAFWPKKHSLAEHDQKVLCVDWAPRTNLIVTGSEDRTAYVWRNSGSKWTPSLVHLGSAVNRAILCCRWSPQENKFAVGTGSNMVCVCYFEEEQNWWVSKLTEAHQSSVTCVAWCPGSNSVLATGSTDSTVRLLSVHLNRIDGGRAPAKFGTQLAVIQAGSWVNGLSWSPDSSLLAFAAQDSSLTILSVSADFSCSPSIRIPTKLLPFRAVAFPNPSVILAAGFDCCVYAFVRGVTWGLRGKLRQSRRGSSSSSSSRLRPSSASSPLIRGSSAALAGSDGG
eukprot:RCo005891